MLPEGNPGPLAPSSYAENLLPYVRGLGERVDIVGEVYSNIDSTDMEPSHWEGLARLISERMDDFDGFLVLHGTCGSVSALFMVLEGVLGSGISLSGCLCVARIYRCLRSFKLQSGSTIFVFNDGAKLRTTTSLLTLER